MIYQAGTTIVYDDGRPGHYVKAVVLNADERGMTVQFEDRADTTRISFNDQAWMKFIAVCA